MFRGSDLKGLGKGLELYFKHALVCVHVNIHVQVCVCVWGYMETRGQCLVSLPYLVDRSFTVPGVHPAISEGSSCLPPQSWD